MSIWFAEKNDLIVQGSNSSMYSYDLHSVKFHINWARAIVQVLSVYFREYDYAYGRICYRGGKMIIISNTERKQRAMP
jgi:hypothetical protein